MSSSLAEIAAGLSGRFIPFAGGVTGKVTQARAASLNRIPVAPRSTSTARSTASRSTASSGPTAAQRAAQAEAQRQAAAAQAARTAANNQSRTSATDEINRLNAQITANQAQLGTNESSLKALQALVGTGAGSHTSVRDSALAAIDQALTTKLGQLQSTFETGFSDFQTNLRDNEASESDASFTNLANRARERGDVYTQALSQGAGESDLLRSQLQALRNWSVNQGEINRAFFDTRASINAGISDLNEATRTGMLNEEMSANTSRGQTFDDFYEAMGRTYSDMSNLDQQNYLLREEIGATERQKANASSLLTWLDAGKNAEDWEAARLQTFAAPAPGAYESEYARRAAEMAGSAWVDPGVSEETQNWQGGAQSEGGLNTTQVLNAQINELGAPARRRPEGATLRRW